MSMSIYAASGLTGAMLERFFEGHPWHAVESHHMDRPGRAGIPKSEMDGLRF